MLAATQVLRSRGAVQAILQARQPCDMCLTMACTRCSRLKSWISARCSMTGLVITIEAAALLCTRQPHTHCGWTCCVCHDIAAAAVAASLTEAAPCRATKHCICNHCSMQCREADQRRAAMATASRCRRTLLREHAQELQPVQLELKVLIRLPCLCQLRSVVPHPLQCRLQVACLYLHAQVIRSSRKWTEISCDKSSK